MGQRQVKRHAWLLSCVLSSGSALYSWYQVTVVLSSHGWAEKASQNSGGLLYTYPS